MSSKRTTLSPRDFEVIAMAFKCFKSEPQIDYAKLAALGGYKNTGTASAIWGPIKKRLLSYAPDASNNAGATDSNATNGNGATLASTPRKRRTKAAADGDAADGTPKKRGRQAAQKVAKHVESEVEDDDEEVQQQEVGGVGVKEEEGDGADVADQLLDGMDEYLKVKAEEVDF